MPDLQMWTMKESWCEDGGEKSRKENRILGRQSDVATDSDLRLLEP